MDSEDEQLTSLLRELSAEDGATEPQGRDAARARLDTEIERAQATGSPRRRRLSRPGAALVAALLAIPAGIAIAGELHDGDPRQEVRDAFGNPAGFVPADCPGLEEAFEEAGVPKAPVVLGECPTPEALEELVSDLLRATGKREPGSAPGGDER